MKRQTEMERNGINTINVETFICYLFQFESLVSVWVKVSTLDTYSHFITIFFLGNIIISCCFFFLLYLSLLFILSRSFNFALSLSVIFSVLSLYSRAHARTHACAIYSLQLCQLLFFHLSLCVYVYMFVCFHGPNVRNHL